MNNRNDNYKINKEMIVCNNDDMSYVALGCVIGEILDRETGQFLKQM